MPESPSSAVPSLPGLAVEVVEWLPSGAESGLVRVRGRWVDDAAREDGLPVLAMHARGSEHRFESLPDARFSREPASWRGTYLVPAELVTTDPAALWLEWGSGARAGLRALARGLEPPPVPAAPERPEAEDTGGQVIDRAVLAERRARRAEAAEQASTRRAAEALKAVEVLELRSAELERRLEEAIAERDALDARGGGSREALSAALSSAAALRARSRDWQVRLRTNEVMRAGDAVRLAVLEAARRDTSGALEAARRDAAGRKAEAGAARREAADRAAELGSANRAAAEARAERDRAAAQLEEVRAAWERRRAELESALGGVRAELAAASDRLRVEAVARTTLEDELDRERAARAALAELEQQAGAARAERDAERTAAGHLNIQLQATRASLADVERQAAAARTERDTERGAAADLRRELEVARAELESERAARHAAEQALETLNARLAEFERRAAAGPEQLDRLAREQAEASAAQEPPADAGRVVADLDAAAEALRQRTAPPANDAGPEPAAPDAEPAVEWGDDAQDGEREPVVPGVEPARPPGDEPQERSWGPPGVAPSESEEAAEPPAPDAEPLVESAPPSEAPAPPAEAPAPPAEAPAPATPPPVSLFAPPVAPTFAPPVAEPVEPRAAGPVVVPASRPPSRGLMVGSARRDYPALRGAIVKFAHDDPERAGRLLAALLPAQGAAIQGPLGYDLTIAGTGTFAVSIAGGRAFAERIEQPRQRGDAEFHLSGEPLLLAELLAGVDHRIGRFFGPVRVRGRKRRLKALRALQSSAVTLPEAARAGAALDPELVYRTFAYAVHPSWTRGHDFTVAQAITGGETWYLSARDGLGVTVSTTGTVPDATVTMSRATFDRLLRGEPVPAGDRPMVRGDRDAVALMRAWTVRAQGA